MALSGVPYVKDENGTKFIAASQRPDGSWRRARRVKEGYVPQEEVPLYESKGKQFVKNVPQYPVGLSEEVINASKAKREKAARSTPKPGLITLTSAENKDKGSKKNKKKKPEQEKLSENLAKVHVTMPSPSSKNLQKEVSKSNRKSAVKPQEPDITSDPAKKLKNLRKKLREIELIEQRIASGDLKKPEKDQLSKIARKEEVMNEISELLFIVDTD